MDFSNKRILITGATSGIGYCTSKKLIDSGANIVIIGRNQSRLEELSAIAPDRVLSITFDLLDFTNYRNLVITLPILDGIVHSAGITHANPLRYFSLKYYQDVININQTSPTLLTAEILRNNKIANGGSIVFLSSINGTKVGIKGSTAYGASKAALVAVSRVVALEVGHKGIRSNCISPGNIETEMISGLTELSERDIEADKRRYPLESRFGKVEEAADAILFLLSNASSFMTGNNLILDGGYSAN